MESIFRVNALITERNRDLFPGELRRLERILVFRRRITSSGLFFQAQISTKISTTSVLLALKHNANVGIDSYKDFKIIVMVVRRFCPLFWLNLLETHCFFSFSRQVLQFFLAKWHTINFYNISKSSLLLQHAWYWQ